jgi:hypothetical protein
MSVEGGGTAAGDVRLPKAMKVKSKQPAQRQITAEQILREAKEIQLEDDFKAPKTIITDPDELAEYRWDALNVNMLCHSACRYMLWAFQEQQ